MREPKLHQFAFLSEADRGPYFVAYDDGEISRLMDRRTAKDYASMFGGVVHRHTQAPKRVRRTVNLLLLAGVMFVAMCSYAQASEFKLLTRAEPVVRMVLQEAAHEPIAGMVAVAGVALDRVADRRWPSTAKQVVYQPWQFTGMAIKLRRYSETQITQARIAVAIAEGGHRPCGTVLWYHTDWVSPKWDYNKINVACVIGGHIFYADKE